MANCCENVMNFNCTDEQFEKRVRPLLEGNDHMGQRKPLTFNVLVPMPGSVYRGSVGTEERKIYGKNNWYDWSNEHWGTKWDAYDVRVDPECVSFTTAWAPPKQWYRELARRLQASGITAHADYYVEGGFPGSLGGYDLSGGVLTDTEADEDFIGIYADEEEEEE